MPQRKSRSVPFESWIDQQIREADERGELANLPGSGKPIPGANRPFDENWWIKDKLRREGASYLPPSLVLRKEVEDALASASRAGSESEARRIIDAVNERIREAIRTPPAGPVHNLVPVDPERVVSDWRERRHR